MDSSSQGSQGFLLLNSSLDQIYADIEAVKILFYPNKLHKGKSLDGLLLEKIRSLLVRKGRSSRLDFVSGLTSGKRQYECRPFMLESQTDRSAEQRFALVLERGRSETPSQELQAFDKFKLTKREREAVLCLVKGLTTKEIAQQMEVSPHTVKAFVRLIMVKMGVTTRSGIVGALYSASH